MLVEKRNPMLHSSKNQLRTLLGLLALCCSLYAFAAPPDTTIVHYYLRDTLCSGQSLFIVNQIFDEFNPVGTILLPGAAANGADSLIHVDLVYREPARTILDQNLCVGDTLLVNGKAYHAHFYLGEETIEGGAANGCDSIIEVNLHVVEPPIDTLNDTLCPGGFRMVNGVRYDRDHPAGTEMLPNAGSNGCDSIVVIALSFKELELSLGPDRRVVSGDTICLQPTLNFIPANLAWLPASPCSDPLCTSNCIHPTAPIMYQLVATDAAGCTVSDEIHIAISVENRVYAPNVFNPTAASPNNRFFLSTGAGVKIIRRLSIADRWGALLFDVVDLIPNQPEVGWDGTAQGKSVLPGVYLFWTELERLDGSTFTTAGTVTVVR